jgi:hypothetical protein
MAARTEVQIAVRQATIALPDRHPFPFPCRRDPEHGRG